MNDTLTIDSLSFVKRYESENGSLRSETSRGVTLTTDLFIRNRSVTQSVTKLPAHETNVKIVRNIEGAAGDIIPVTFSASLVYPKDASVVSADLTAVVQHLISLLSTETTTGLDLDGNIYINQEQ